MVCVHSIDHVMYCNIIMFMWVARVAGYNGTSYGRFPVYVEVKILCSFLHCVIDGDVYFFLYSKFHRGCRVIERIGKFMFVSVGIIVYY